MSAVLPQSCGRVLHAGSHGPFVAAGRPHFHLSSHRRSCAWAPLHGAISSNTYGPEPCTSSRHGQPSTSTRLHARASDALAAAEGVPQPSRSSGSVVRWALGGVAVAAAIGLGYASTTGQAATLKAALIDGPLGRSGFLAAFSLIFLSEIGDKTFFIAALLAMRLGRWISFVGSVSALSVMTVISVAIGAVFSRVPDALKSSVPIGEIAGVVLLVVFGIRALRDATKADDGAPSTSDSELADAESRLAEAESSGSITTKHKGRLSSLFEVAGLIFVAEWGDRSMLATIALGAAQSPVGVATGACMGHAIATAIAVLGGAIAGQYVSERDVSLVSGVLFLVFAAATVLSMTMA